MKITLFVILLLVNSIKGEQFHFTCEYINMNISIIKRVISNCCYLSGFLTVHSEEVDLVPSYFHRGGSINCFVAVNKELVYFPTRIEHFDNTLTYVTITNSSMKYIRAESLRNFHSLSYLDLSYNKIEFLYKNVFRSSTNLIYIILSNNKIQFVHPDAFISYNHYKCLDLRNNSCISNLSTGDTNILKLINDMKNPNTCGLDNSSKTSTCHVDDHQTTIKPNNKDTMEQDIAHLKSQIAKQNKIIQNLLGQISGLSSSQHDVNNQIQIINFTCQQQSSKLSDENSINNMTAEIQSLKNSVKTLNDSVLIHQSLSRNENRVTSESSILLASNALCFLILIIIIFYLIWSRRSTKETPKMKRLEEEPSNYDIDDNRLPQPEMRLQVQENIYQQQASYEEINYVSGATKPANNFEVEDFYAEIVSKIEGNMNDKNEDYTVVYKGNGI